MKKQREKIPVSSNQMPSGAQRGILSTLAGAGLIVMASSRTAFALVTFGALLWVYGLSALVIVFCRPFLPQRGRQVIILFLPAFLGSLYLLLLAFLNPLLALDCGLLILLTAPCFAASGLGSGEGAHTIAGLRSALREAAALGALTAAFSLVREPLGSGSLSLPGGPRGLLLRNLGGGRFIPMRILAVSSGCLILAGFALAMYRGFRRRGNREEALP
ncbi:MAG: hypothetical protein LBR16_09440 [Treponema sp.]|jgi:hypothetical protein|nr:hypothetical protein [Treponema sp.]